MSSQSGATAADGEKRRRGGWWWLAALVLLLVVLAILAAALGWFDSSSKHATTKAGGPAVTSPATSAPAASPSTASSAITGPAAVATTAPAGSGVATGGGTAPANGLVGGGAVTPTAATGMLTASGSVGDVLFSEAGAALDSDAQTVVNQAVALIRQDHATTVTVTGYTDGIGDPTANQQLSIERANAVIDALKAQLGTSVTFNGAAYGQTQPVATNATAAGRQLNRRVGIVAN